MEIHIKKLLKMSFLYNFEFSQNLAEYMNQRIKNSTKIYCFSCE